MWRIRCVFVIMWFSFWRCDFRKKHMWFSVGILFWLLSIWWTKWDQFTITIQHNFHTNIHSHRVASHQTNEDSRQKTTSWDPLKVQGSEMAIQSKRFSRLFHTPRTRRSRNSKAMVKSVRITEFHGISYVACPHFSRWILGSNHRRRDHKLLLPLRQTKVWCVFSLWVAFALDNLLAVLGSTSSLWTK